MLEPTEILPLTETFEPADQAELAEIVRRAHQSRTPIYPIGGGTSLEFGGLPSPPRGRGAGGEGIDSPLPAVLRSGRGAGGEGVRGWGLSLAGLNRVIDYPARDMTITVEAGMKMVALAETLAAEGQRLPIDAPQAEQATIGGVVATNTSGPRRYGNGTVRDYVIGISAVDGRGMPFKGGGRVVKNVAGYDFCKLLTGSLGTLGVITQVTLKLKPLPEAAAFVACDLPDFDQTEWLLAALVTSQTTPAAIELLVGPVRTHDPAIGAAEAGAVARLAVGLEGTRAEVDWMVQRLSSEWRELGVANCVTIVSKDEVDGLWQRLTEYPESAAVPLVVKASVLPSKLCQFCRRVLEFDADCSIQAHAGNGIVVARLSHFDPADAARVLVRRLQPAAAACGGHAIVLSCTHAAELTRQAIWGGATDDLRVMQAVREQFDPHGILNPGRFF